jgi:hypothetical protein
MLRLLPMRCYAAAAERAAEARTRAHDRCQPVLESLSISRNKDLPKLVGAEPSAASHRRCPRHRRDAFVKACSVRRSEFSRLSRST